MKKTVLSLIIETGFSKKVNRIIFEEILKTNSSKNAIKFIKEYRIIQRFNCYKYEQIDKKCKSVTKCNHCAKRLKTNRCNKNEIKTIYKCVNCEYTEHQI